MFYVVLIFGGRIPVLFFALIQTVIRKTTSPHCPSTFKLTFLLHYSGNDKAQYEVSTSANLGPEKNTLLFTKSKYPPNKRETYQHP